MATEIELKAHVEDSEALKNLLKERAEYLCAFEKEDKYFFPEWAPGHFPSGVRIRSEKRTLPDGKSRTLCFVTYKVKEVMNGIEINDEREFEICSPSGQSAGEFEEFLIKLGLKPGLSKRKKGWAFSHENITAELVEVRNLGWFVELEIMADGISSENCPENKNNEEILAEKRGRLIDFLDSLGISKEAIESRFYSEMLASNR